MLSAAMTTAEIKHQIAEEEDRAAAELEQFLHKIRFNVGCSVIDEQRHRDLVKQTPGRGAEEDFAETAVTEGSHDKQPCADF
jgi:hypothetical protein